MFLLNILFYQASYFWPEVYTLVLILPLPNDYFAVYRILNSLVFSLSTWKLLFHCLLVIIIVIKKSVICQCAFIVHLSFLFGKFEEIISLMIPNMFSCDFLDIFDLRMFSFEQF